MRLLHVYSGNLYGGVERMLVTMTAPVSAIPGMQHEVALCYSGRLRDELQEARVVVHMLPSARLRAPLTVLRARKRLDAITVSSQPDAMIFHSPWSLGMFGRSAGRRQLPAVLWQHDRAGDHFVDRFSRLVQPRLVICNSRYTASTLGSRYPDAQRRVVRCPVKCPDVGSRTEMRSRTRAALGIPHDATVIAHVSRMEPWKGHGSLLAALATLRKVPRWRLLVVGGPQRESERRYFDDIRETAARLGIADRVVWAGEQRDVMPLLSAADFYCQPNTEPEPFGIAFIEALWMGLPVIATGAGGPLEIVSDTCGLLVTPGDGAGLAAAIRRLCEDDDVRNAMSAAAPLRAAELCDPADRMVELRAALETVCSAAN
jgi:glycosyltransferase involved in cell wall biosynthesis